MLKFHNFDIVFSEIPDEVTLAINITNCPNRCKGCHSPWLQEDKGNELNEESIALLLRQYGSTITCVCFMGGDGEPLEVERLAKYIHTNHHEMKAAWYSGKPSLPPTFDISPFQYIKVGPYIAQYGSLKSRTTNQHLYKISSDGSKEDITYRFWK
jgi:anaerobic ribonucleoside-triphosphate reductase activating protein